MKWEKVRLEDCCYSISDGDHQPPPKAQQGIPFVTISNINSMNQLDFSDTMFVPKEYYQSLDEKRKVRKGDVLYSVVGSFGIPVLIKEERPFVFQRHIAILRPKEDIVDSGFLFYTMLNRDFYAKADAVAIGAAQRTVSLGSLRNIKIDVPSFESQKHIADILSAYDDLIENNQKQIKLLEEAAQRLYKEWFVDLHFPGHENTKIVDGVPEGWSKSTVSEVSAILRRGISPKYNEKARGIVINQKCIRQTIVSYDEARTQEKKYPDELKMMESDILICSTGAGTLGRVGQIFEAKENVTLDSHVTLIRANERVGQQYLFWSLKMQQDYLMSAGKGSTNQLELSRETIGNCKILIPEQKIAEQVEKNFVAIHNKMRECSMQIARLREARDLLLPKLMSGEVEV